MNFNLFLFGDVHDGSRSTSEDGWNQLVDMMHSNYKGVPATANYGWDTGDMCESIMIDDRRFSYELHDEPFPMLQVDKCVQKRLPIKRKLIGANIGNHEWKLLKFGNITEKVCRELNVEYGTWSSRVTFVYKRRKTDNVLFKALFTHGHRTINSIAKSAELRQANMQDMLREALKRKAGGCILAAMGHCHKLLIAPPIPELVIDDDGSKIHQMYTKPNPLSNNIRPYERWYVATGSFSRLYPGNGLTGYAERFGYDPVEIGFAIVRVRDGEINGVDKIVL